MEKAQGTKQEKMIQKKVALMEKREKQLGVRVVVEFTGHLDKPKLERFTQMLSSVLVEHMENGGGGN